MQTESVMLQTLCVPCANRCRHCLLSWNGKTIGADYETASAFALSLREWIAKERPWIQFNFSFGYSMDHPRLTDALDLMNSMGSVTGEFMHMDGLQFRTDEEISRFIGDLRAHGVSSVNFTFYGTEKYHDRFAGREGDFAYLIRLAKTAKAEGLGISCGIMLTHESAPLAEELINSLRTVPFSDENRGIKLIVPHSEGRGRLMENIRLNEADYEALPQSVAALLNRNVFKTEAEWLREKLTDETRRALLISLTPENIGEYGAMGFEALIAHAEALDDAYYAQLPSVEELCKLYGDPNGCGFYSRRDLLDRYRKRFIKDAGLSVYDVTDERQTGSRRY